MMGDDTTAARFLLLSVQELAVGVRTEQGQTAFYIGELYQRVMQKLIAVALRNVADCDTAEDIAHEVFVEKVVVRHLSEYSDGNFMGWLCTCVQNRCKSYHKSAVQRREQLTDDDSLDGMRSDRQAASPEVEALNDLAFQSAWARFDQEASDLEKQTLILYLQMEEVKVVAEVMARPADQVSNILYKARKRLARLLAECGYSG